MIKAKNLLECVMRKVWECDVLSVSTCYLMTNPMILDGAAEASHACFNKLSAFGSRFMTKATANQPELFFL